MATDLRVTNPAVPEGYAASEEVWDGVMYVQVHDAGGELAAKGQMALLGEVVVVDRVVTEVAHRRRGLGNFVMRTLADRAVARGATLGSSGRRTRAVRCTRRWGGSATARWRTASTVPGRAVGARLATGALRESP